MTAGINALPDSRDPVPNFDACGVCGADAQENVVWDVGDGWTCLMCWATDGGD